MVILKLLFWASFCAILICWIIYPIFVCVAAQVRKVFWKRKGYSQANELGYSIIIAAYNEEDRISQRIRNLRQLNCENFVEILIGSDGSTDNTLEAAKQSGYPEVKVYAFEKNRGRASVHNDCVRHAKGDIIIFTDAETNFESDFIQRIGPHFGAPSVGAVSGRIMYLNENHSSISKTAGVYWQYEEIIRRSESALGILGFGTGACLAMRKEIYRPIGVTEDVDYAATLDAIANGYRVLYEPDALAYDYISETASGAFRTRIRQTSRCFKSVLRRIFATPILMRRPGIFAAALIHKTFRHLTPLFMLFLLVANFLLISRGSLYDSLFLLQVFFYSLAAAGYLFSGLFSGRFSSLIFFPYNFTLLNISRGIGVIIAVFGKDRATYRTAR